MEPIVLSLITVVLIIAHILLMKKPRTLKRIFEVIYIYLMFILIGLGAITAFIMHVFLGPKTAAMIGWAAGSPFQYEVGVADLAFGVVAVLTPWIRGTYWLAAALANAVFLIGCAAGHISDLVLQGNTAIYNAGPTLYISDIALPILVLVLALAIPRINDSKPIKAKRRK